VKAANLLIDDDGTVLLGDLGVAASLADDADPISPLSKSSPVDNTAGHPKRVVNFAVPQTRPKMGKRKSFVGTVSLICPAY
jgi:serine/threonine-protein kinase OSR1/STK39